VTTCCAGAGAGAGAGAALDDVEELGGGGNEAAVLEAAGSLATRRTITESGVRLNEDKELASLITFP